MKYYQRFRFALMTFAFGLASVFVSSGLDNSANNIPVNLPKVNFEPMTLVFTSPKNSFAETVIFTEDKATDESELGGGASGGITCDEARERAKNKKIKIPNCD